MKRAPLKRKTALRRGESRLGLSKKAKAKLSAKLSRYANAAGTLKRSPIRRQSKRMATVKADRRRLLKKLIEERGDICELRFSPHCRHKAQGLHEPLKQSASPWKVGDYERGRIVMLSCNPCNCHVEDEPLAAKEAGLTESRFGQFDK